MACSPSLASTPNIEAGISSAITGKDSGWYILEGGNFSSSLGGRSIDASDAASPTELCRASTSPTSLGTRPVPLCRRWRVGDAEMLSLEEPLPLGSWTAFRWSWAASWTSSDSFSLG